MNTPLLRVHPPAATGHCVLVVLDHTHADQRDLVPLVPVGHTQLGSRAQAGAAFAGALVGAVLVVVTLVPPAPTQRGPGAPGCLPFDRPEGLARRSLRGGVRPGPSSSEDGMEELPLTASPPGLAHRPSSAAQRDHAPTTR